MTVELGTVFWFDDQNGGHFWVVITPPSFPEVLVVNFTTQGPRKDQSCVLQANSHPVIKHESVVSFDNAEVFSTADVDRCLNNGTFKLYPQASKQLMLQIWEGAFKTKRMTIRCRELLDLTVPN